MGARVIKVETPGTGDDTRGRARAVRGPRGRPDLDLLPLVQNSESVTLDLKSDDGRATLTRLVRRGDVLIEHFRPGVLDRLGLLGRAAARDQPAPGLLSISGPGTTARRAAARLRPDRAGRGRPHVAHRALPTGRRVGVQIGDLLAGMYGAYGVVAALHERTATGRGRVVRTSLLAAIVGVHAFQGTRYTVAGEVGHAQGNHHPSITPYGLFECKDGMLQIACGGEVCGSLATAFGIDPAVRAWPPTASGSPTATPSTPRSTPPSPTAPSPTCSPLSTRSASRLARSAPSTASTNGTRHARRAARHRPPGPRPDRDPRAADPVRRQRVRGDASSTSPYPRWAAQRVRAGVARRAGRGQPLMGEKQRRLDWSGFETVLDDGTGRAGTTARCSPPSRTARMPPSSPQRPTRPGPTSPSSRARAPSADAAWPSSPASSASWPARSAASPRADRAGFERAMREELALRRARLGRHAHAGGHPPSSAWSRSAPPVPPSSPPACSYRLPAPPHDRRGLRVVGLARARHRRRARRHGRLPRRPRLRGALRPALPRGRRRRRTSSSTA